MAHCTPRTQDTSKPVPEVMHAARMTKKAKLAETSNATHVLNNDATRVPVHAIDSSTHINIATTAATNVVGAHDYMSNVSTAKKTKIKTKRLPSRMLIRATWSQEGCMAYEFLHTIDKTLSAPQQLYQALGSKCQQVCMIPRSDQMIKVGWCLYADDDGMRKSLAMNTMINPFMTEWDILHMGLVGGPFGNVIVDGDGSMLNRAKLLAMCKDADQRDETDGAFETAMRKALDAWDATS